MSNEGRMKVGRKSNRCRMKREDRKIVRETAKCRTIGRRTQNNTAQDARQQDVGHIWQVQDDKAQDRWCCGAAIVAAMAPRRCYYFSDGAARDAATLRRYSIVALQLAATADNSALCNDGEQR
ncbi:unnamed protein product [Sphagnum troendelagicum]